MRPLILVAATLVTLTMTRPASAQYVTYYNGYNPYAAAAHAYYANPYNDMGYGPQYYPSAPSLRFQPSVYGYNPNVYGYNPNVYFSPSAYRQSRYTSSYYAPYQFRTYTYSYLR